MTKINEGKVFKKSGGKISSTKYYTFTITAANSIYYDE
jgi:hypothetical protein